MTVLRKAEDKLFSKEIINKGYGFHTPQDGSVCRIKMIVDEKQIIIDLDDNNEKEIVVGDVDEPVDRILEDCIRTMKEGEECLLKFLHPLLINNTIIPVDSQDVTVPESVDNKNDPPMDSAEEESDGAKTEDLGHEEESVEITEPVTSVSDDQKQTNSSSENENESNVVELRFQLLSYTREPEIWEMSITEKWRRASYHKQRGLELYSRGSYQHAFRRFGLTLKYVISLEHDIPSGQEEGMDIKGLKLSCYLNVAACQMRHHNFESVVMNSSKALTIQPNNAKALYRRGSAYLQLQEFEKAKEDLDKAQEYEPKNQAIAKQQQLLKIQVQKLNQYYASAMKKLFS